MVGASLSFGALLRSFDYIKLIKIIQGAAMVTIALNICALWQQEPRGMARQLTEQLEREVNAADFLKEQSTAKPAPGPAVTPVTPTPPPGSPPTPAPMAATSQYPSPLAADAPPHTPTETALPTATPKPPDE